MKIGLDNVNLSSQNGPNSFANKMIPYFIKSGHELVTMPDADNAVFYRVYVRQD